MFWAELVPSSLFFMLMWIVPESPRWLAKRKKHDKVVQILSRLGNKEYALQEAAEIENTLKNDTEMVNFRSLLSPDLIRVLIIGIVLAVATFSLWAASFILVYTFPFINRAFGTGGAIWLYGLVCIGGFIFIKKRVIETKGKSLEQIERELVNNSPE